jgi:signal transduction histidine kinase/CheY-like chemotaxis protein
VSDPPNAIAPDGRLERLAADLADAVEQQRATSQVLEAIGRSHYELHPVFETVVRHAVHLSGADGGMVYQLDDGVYRMVLAIGGSEEYRSYLQEHPVAAGTKTVVGRVGLERRIVQFDDARDDPAYGWREALELGGFRTLLGVPMLAGDDVVGVIVLWRAVVEPFGDRTIRLVNTFAAQGAIAIQNVQLFCALEARTEELEVAGRHKSEFLAGMSHELRTPLNAVIGFSDVLLDRMFGDLNERQEEYVRDIRDSGRHLLELINEILDLAKIEAGRMEVDLGVVSLPALLEHAVTMLRDRASAQRVRLTLDVAPGLGTVRGDELKLKQVVVNLVSNAVKFTPDGGAVDVEAHPEGGEVVVTVRDTGIGIADEERERIFEAFQRGDRGVRTSTEGTGLGLTLSRRIVEMHGGRIWMESRLGEGSTFSFAIPRATAAADEPAAEPEPRAPAAAGQVLVIEDDRPSADLLQVYLEDAGYPVAIGRDGIEGLQLARELRPIAVILDILLPGLGGWELLAELKRDPATAAIPVVIVSMLDERGAGFALGAAEYLVKPVDRREVLGALARCVAPPGDGRSVVVIDDEPLDLDLVEATLTPLGWRVLRAEGGEEGVELVRRERPAAVLVDLLMPTVDGFEVVERLRADPALAATPIVVVTSKDMTAGDRERLQGRISHLAQKGTFKQEELADVIARVTAAAKADRAPGP